MNNPTKVLATVVILALAGVAVYMTEYYMPSSTSTQHTTVINPAPTSTQGPIVTDKLPNVPPVVAPVVTTPASPNVMPKQKLVVKHKRKHGLSRTETDAYSLAYHNAITANALLRAFPVATLTSDGWPEGPMEAYPYREHP